MDQLILVLIIFFAVVVFTEFVIFICFRICFHRTGSSPVKIKIPDTYAPLIERATKLFDRTEKQDVYVTAFDGIKLHGVFIKGTRDGFTTEILFHGYRSSAYDFAGGFEFYKSLGINLLFVDQRAHGKSDGKYITFGIHESRDVLSWVNYVSDHIGGSIYLGGISMGASTVMMSAGRGLPDCVKGIIADCGYSSPKEIITYVLCKKYHLPKFFAKLIIKNFNLFARLFGKFDINEMTAPLALHKCDLPVLITHGTEDRLVPPVMSEINAESCKCPHKLIKVQGARHGFAYPVDPDTCYGAIIEMFPSIIGTGTPFIPH